MGILIAKSAMNSTPSLNKELIKVHNTYFFFFKNHDFLHRYYYCNDEIIFEFYFFCESAFGRCWSSPHRF